MRFSPFLLSLRRSLPLRAGHGHGHGTPFHGFDQPAVDPRYKAVATVIGTAMWFWLFYRAREDGGVLLGFHKPWEAHAHHDSHDSHDEHHAEGEAKHH
jgi:hypothetical protein